MSKSEKTTEYRNFVKLTDRLLAVPRVTLDQRLKQHREQAEQNPNKRGPKPKPSASVRDEDEP